MDVRSELSETAKEVERLKTESSQHKVQALQQEKQELLASRLEQYILNLNYCFF